MDDILTRHADQVAAVIVEPVVQNAGGMRFHSPRYLSALPGVHDVRVLGAIGVVQLDHQVDMPAATRAALREGVWLRPFRDLVYTMPTYIATDDDLTQITTAMLAAAQQR